ncbi:MAG: cysteine--tRNA ligase [Pseudomonadota bacterium]|nr:cysteine--tRNA ligase [Pseudomonadota bacterium]
MALRFYNTMTRRKEEFQPLVPGKAGIYACGITAYDLCHIGHARSAIVFDVIVRYMRYRGLDVTFVKNFTDVDDKIIERARAEGCAIAAISEKYIGSHDRDMDALGVERPTIAPRATENIDGMIRMIARLLERGLAYAVPDGDVYFAVDKFPDYGKLSGRNLEDMQAGARIDVNERKRHPMDFALWKASKEGEPAWDSPWGPGRPGWHIECSVMSQRYLGDTFDIHGGGEDLIFPHHENEIAQSEGATGKTFARYWIHNGFVRVNSEKMSKSLGNFSTIQDMLQVCHPEVLRLFVLQSHYRSPVDFSEESLREARAGMDRFYSTLRHLEETRHRYGDAATELGEEALPERDRLALERIRALPGRFIEAMDDDFNTARALGHLFDAVRVLNGYLAQGQHTPGAAAVRVLADSREILRQTAAVLGLLREEPERYFEADRDREARKLGLDVAEIESLVAERLRARERRDWPRADEIRRLLLDKNIVLKDRPDGTAWKIA